jgi:hypothetical protein
MSLNPVTIAFELASGGTCQQLALSTVAVQSANIDADMVEITPSVDCYARAGSNPTALSTGVDHFLVANDTRLFAIRQGEKISFITAVGSGSVKLAPVCGINCNL